MTPSPVGPDHVQLQLGLYVLGALDADDVGPVERHLAGCADCRAECARLGEVMDYLALLSPDDVASIADDFPITGTPTARPSTPTTRPATPAVPSSTARPSAPTYPVSPGVGPITRAAPAPRRPPPRPPTDRGSRHPAEPAGRPGSRRPGRIRAVLAAVALALVTGVVIGIRLASNDPTAVTFAGSQTDATTGVTMSVTVVGPDRPAHVTASVGGLSPGTGYRLYAVDADGRTLTVARWTAGSGPYTYAGDVDVRADDLAFFSVTQSDGRVVLTVRVARSA